MTFIRIAASIVMALACSILAAYASDGQRYALVIGNGNYAKLAPLSNPVNDASDIGGALAKAGFDVTFGLDVTRQEFADLLQQFARRSRDGSAVAFYFAGHGFEFNNANYLVPIDARLSGQDDIAAKTFDLKSIIAALQQPNRPAIVILDACRNNPLPDTLRSGDTSQGLAEIDTGRDLFVAFAAEPHKAAANGTGRNSPFSQALLTHLRRPGLSISDLMVDVRKDVYLSTDGKQLPWDQSSLREQYYFWPSKPLTEKLTETASKTAGGSGAEDPVTRSATFDNSAEPTNDTGEARTKDAAAKSKATQRETAAAGDRKTQKPVRKHFREDRNHPQDAQPRVVKAKEKKKRSTVVQGTRQGRPNARAYSFGIWPIGNLRSGGVSRKSTPFGMLMCTAFANGTRNKAGDEIRMCRWQ